MDLCKSSLGLGFHFSNSHDLSSRSHKRKSNLHIRQEMRIIDPISNPEEITKNSQKSHEHNLPPLITALKSSSSRKVSSFHFPGHNRGRAAPSSITNLIGLKPFTHDLPELPELDNLFTPVGPILEAQREAAKLFGSSETWFLVGGSTCGIQAAIMATCSPGDYLILPRNSHLSAISAMVLTGVDPMYIVPDYDPFWDIPGGVTSSQVDKAMKEVEMEGGKVGAVFVTSPTYHGICSNLSEISQLCHSREIPLIVDEAHGAHLGFHPHLPNSALQQGADIAIQSTHKVLCSLTQSSMLHMSGNIVNRERICRCLQTLQSTSPSYLLLVSLDAARAQLSENPDKIFGKAMELATLAKDMIRKIPDISVLDFPAFFSNFHAIDPLRLTVGFQHLALSGYEADEILDTNYGIISELVGTHSMTFAINLGTSEDDIHRLVSCLNHVALTCSSQTDGGREDDRVYLEPFKEVRMRLNPRDAFFASKKRVSIEESIGEICGELICPYPPGIPVLIPGDVITESALEYLMLVRRRSKGDSVIIGGASDPLLASILVCDM